MASVPVPQPTSRMRREPVGMASTRRRLRAQPALAFRGASALRRLFRAVGFGACAALLIAQMGCGSPAPSAIDGGSSDQDAEAADAGEDATVPEDGASADAAADGGACEVTPPAQGEPDLEQLCGSVPSTLEEWEQCLPEAALRVADGLLRSRRLPRPGRVHGMGLGATTAYGAASRKPASAQLAATTATAGPGPGVTSSAACAEPPCPRAPSAPTGVSVAARPSAWGCRSAIPIRVRASAWMKPAPIVTSSAAVPCTAGTSSRPTTSVRVSPCRSWGRRARSA
jgi:hypothetical protein